VQSKTETIDWIERAQGLAPAIAAASDRIERERRIDDDVLAAIDRADIPRMLLPVSLGGGAADIMTFNRVIEALAAADASTAWCVAQSLASSHSAGFLDPQIAREVFGAPRAIVAWGPPGGPTRAQVVDGGYRVTGRWRFASGSANATWMGGHSQVYERDGTPRLDAAGRPVMRTMLFRPSQATIHDTWHVIGLRGTASNDYEVADLFVPEPYTTWRDQASDRRRAVRSTTFRC
jgi:alkylation response protein AidB-like acyl-CoA dehydrogenase